MRISDWSSDVCSSDLTEGPHESRYFRFLETDYRVCDFQFQIARIEWLTSTGFVRSYTFDGGRQDETGVITFFEIKAHQAYFEEPRSEEHTSELQSLMRISYAVFCLKKKNK